MGVRLRRRSGYEVDMLHGPLLPKIIRFAVLLMVSNMLQLLYNAADLIVVGQFSGSETAVAAVGATGSLCNLIVNFFIGLSVGVSVLVARGYGTGNRKSVEEVVHTAITVALISGVIVLLIGVFGSSTFLRWMDTSPAVIEQSSLYLKIYFLGAPLNLIYNFGASILRATGDTKRPLYFLAISGLANVVLNFIFVYYLHMDVAGVAIATITSQGISAVLVVLCLMKQDGMCRFYIRKMRVNLEVLGQIIKIGVPASIQSCLFAISNVMIQSSINSFDAPYVALGKAPHMSGASAAGNLEGFVYTSMNSFYQAALNFTGQNAAAKKYRRMRKVWRYCLLCSTVIGAALGAVVILFGESLLGIYIPGDTEAIEIGCRRLMLLCSTYWLCGLMDVTVGQLRGLGHSLVPMLVTVAGACGLRIVWIATAFAANRSWLVLHLAWPVSWIVTFSVLAVCYLVIQRRFPKEDVPDAAPAAEAEAT